MANFPTHVLGAVATGIVATSVLAAAGLLPLASVASGIGLVALGGIFPDVDSDQSDAITMVFDTLSVAIAAPLMIASVPTVGLLVSVGLLVAVHVVVRYALIVPFRWYSVHRGRFHSIPTGLLLGGGVALATHRGFGLDDVQSWLFGGLFLLGFLVHLVLDELYSVDLGNRRIKRSFGTALKLGDRDDLLGYALLYAATAAVLAFTPSPMPLVAACADVDLALLPPPEVISMFTER